MTKILVIQIVLFKTDNLNDKNNDSFDDENYDYQLTLPTDVMIVEKG